jgi:2-oxoglutarate dehydrogenase E2 component (dihydrolipoamide succinyltransferase)
MLVDVVVPEVAESIHEVQILSWKKKAGDDVRKDDELVEVETEKATVPIAAPADGRLAEVLVEEGQFAQVGDVIARLDPSAEPVHGRPDRPSVQAADRTAEAQREATASPPPLASSPAQATDNRAVTKATPKTREKAATEDGNGRAGAPAKSRTKRSAGMISAAPRSLEAVLPAPALPSAASSSGGRPVRRVRMNLLRKTIARRLVEAQQTTAHVTTFNEIDMHEVIALRRDFGETFKDHFDIKLGFMSFFVKAVVEALKEFPEVNARIAGDEIVYHDYYDIGVAIGAGRGLVVPVLRDCQELSFAQIEQAIADLAQKAAESKLAPQDLEGGTFTISNGGVYGSLLSTPIINPPQSGVLGLHAIQERAIAKDGQIVIRPMMYVALSYDHRLVDGREAVGFLRRVKDVIETPARLFLGV